MQHKTKYGTASITDNGTVCLEFVEQQMKISITSNGLQVMLLQLLTSLQLTQVVKQVSKMYTFYELPAKLAKYYDYAHNFVNIVKSKTPKVRAASVLLIH